eukprot:7620300-Pyramimonas_sp.AAC.1
MKVVALGLVRAADCFVLAVGRSWLLRWSQAPRGGAVRRSLIRLRLRRPPLVLLFLLRLLRSMDAHTVPPRGARDSGVRSLARPIPAWRVVAWAAGPLPSARAPPGPLPSPGPPAVPAWGHGPLV